MLLREGKLKLLRRFAQVGITLIACALLSSCLDTKRSKTVISMSMTPWVGYYPLYYAVARGIPERFNADVNIVETMSVQDFRRANLKSHVDGFISSNMEVAQSNMIIAEPLVYVLAADYSNGGDVIIATADIKSMEDLNGKRIGFEWDALGHYFVNAAFSTVEIHDPNYKFVNIEQVSAADSFAKGELEGYATYPPISTQLIEEHEGLHAVFDSSEIPYLVSDIMVLKESRKDKADLLKQIWWSAIDLIEQDPEAYAEFVALQINSDVETAKQEMSGVRLIPKDRQEWFMKGDLINTFNLACGVNPSNMKSCIDAFEKLYIDGQSVKSMMSVKPGQMRGNQ